MGSLDFGEDTGRGELGNWRIMAEVTLELKNLNSLDYGIFSGCHRRVHWLDPCSSLP